MKHVVLISCVKTKATERKRCDELYLSDLFKKSLAYAHSLKPDRIFILSAKHGLVALDQELDPYDDTLNTMKVPQIKLWSNKVLDQLRQVADLKADRFTFLAAEKYRRFLLPQLDQFEIPMKGLGIGRQLQFLKERTR